MNVQKEVASPALSVVHSINGEERESRDDVTLKTPDWLREETRDIEEEPSFEGDSNRKETSATIGILFDRPSLSGKSTVREQAKISNVPAKGTKPMAGGVEKPPQGQGVPTPPAAQSQSPKGKPVGIQANVPKGGTKTSLSATVGSGKPLEQNKPKTLLKEAKLASSKPSPPRPAPDPPAREKPKKEKEARNGRLSEEIFRWAGENHKDLRDAFKKSDGAKRMALMKQLQDLHLQEQEEEDPCGDDPEAALEEREAQGGGREPAPPKPKNVPINLWRRHNREFVDGDTNCRYYEVAMPDVHSWWFFFACLIGFVYCSALSAVSLSVLPLCILCGMAAVIERLCTIRWDKQYSQAATPTGRRGVFRELTCHLQVLHWLFLGCWVGFIIYLYAYTVALIGLMLFANWWTALVDAPCCIVLVALLLLGYRRLRQEFVSVLRQRLTLNGPTDQGIIRGERLNDPDNDSYCADLRTEADKTTDLTIPTVSIGSAVFAVSVACSTDSAPVEKLLFLHKLFSSADFKYYGHGELSYSMAELEQYLTASNTNILMDYKTMHERMQNYRSSFARVAFGAYQGLRVQELRTNSAWMAAFIALSQQLILASVAGKALPLTVMA